jgi:alpha-L-arabinofuranosidase
MMELYSTAEPCQSLKTEVVSGTFDTKTMNPGFAGVKEAKYLDVSARLRPDGKTIDLFVINRNLEGSIDGTILFNGGSIETDVQAAILGAPALLAWKTFDEPHRVAIQRIHLQAAAGSLTYRFPAHSLVAFTFRRKPA